jgi:hypothetical protein
MLDFSAVRRQKKPGTGQAPGLRSTHKRLGGLPLVVVEELFLKLENNYTATFLIRGPIVRSQTDRAGIVVFFL